MATKTPDPTGRCKPDSLDALVDARIMARFKELTSPGQGARTDRKGASSAGTTLLRVAKLQGSTKNAVKDRATIQKSKLTIPELWKAVEGKTIARSTAATKVRELEGLVKSGSLTEVEGKKKLEAWATAGRPSAPKNVKKKAAGVVRKKAEPAPAAPRAVTKGGGSPAVHIAVIEKIDTVVANYTSARGEILGLAVQLADITKDHLRFQRSPNFCKSRGDIMMALTISGKAFLMLTSVNVSELRDVLLELASYESQP